MAVLRGDYGGYACCSLTIRARRPLAARTLRSGIWRVGAAALALAAACQRPGVAPAKEAVGGPPPAKSGTPSAGSPALDGAEGRPLALDQFAPRSMLSVPATPTPRAKFPVVDVHVHPRYKARHSPEALAELVRVMDSQNVAVCVSLDGGLDAQLEEHKEYLWKTHRDRFVIFANIDWRGDGKENEPATWDCQRPDFGRRMAAALTRAKEAGAAGLKVFKELGLGYRNADASLIAIDDPRWDPIWKACGDLGMPVLIHTGDPLAFFLPVDRFNERWEELQRHPDWSYADERFPRPAALFAARNRVMARHPRTTFIGAHVGSSAENLAQAASWLDDYPNFHVDLAARIAELGRQPVTARQFFVQYADRILFGTDGPRTPERMRPHWRLLETRDEYFPYAEEQYPPQGLWNIYGLDLPDEALKKVYHENAARLVPGVRERLERLGKLPPPPP